VPLIPTAFNNLEPHAFYAIVVCNGVGLGLLILGLLFDNVLIWPDVLYEETVRKRKKQPPWLMCHNPSCGCVMTSHAFWHIAALLSVVIATLGREIALESLNLDA
jgi:hypothetical protein